MSSNKKLRHLHELREDVWRCFGYDSPEMRDVDNIIKYWANDGFYEDPKPLMSDLILIIDRLKNEIANLKGIHINDH